jgi:hypothetical protein
MELVNISGQSFMAKKNPKPVTVLSSVNPAIITVAKSLLNEAGIKYVIRDSNIKGISNSGNPLDAYSGLIEIQVTGDENIISARKILVDLEELEFRDRHKHIA